MGWGQPHRPRGAAEVLDQDVTLDLTTPKPGTLGARLRETGLAAEVETLRQVVRLLHYRFDDHFTRVWWELDTDLVALTREQAAAVERALGER